MGSKDCWYTTGILLLHHPLSTDCLLKLRASTIHPINLKVQKRVPYFLYTFNNRIFLQESVATPGLIFPRDTFKLVLHSGILGEGAFEEKKNPHSGMAALECEVLDLNIF